MNKILTTSILALLASSAYAGPIYVNTSVDYNSDGDTRTQNFDEFGYSGTRSTSFYKTSEFLNPSSTSYYVRDTNISTTMNSLGFSLSQTAIDSSTVDFIPGGSIQPYNYNSIPGNSNFDSLNTVDPNTEDAENFGLANGWGLWYQYDISGSLNIATQQSNFNNGFINAFYYDQAAFSAALAAAPNVDIDPLTPGIQKDALAILAPLSQQVLSLVVQSSFNDAGGLHVKGYANYDFNGDSIDNDTNAFQQNFLNDADRGTSLYSLWSIGDMSTIQWVLDTNVDPVLPTTSSLVAGTTGEYLYRQGRLDGSLVFNVPEPGSLALMGLGFIAMGGYRRRKV